MDFLNGLALVLLTLVGYSSGAVLGAKGRTAVPAILDLVLVVLLWFAALFTRGMFGRWIGFAVWIAVGLILGMVFAWVRASKYPKAPVETYGKGFKNSWKAFAQRMGNYQSRVIMAFIYFTIILPFGLGITLLGDYLGIKRDPKGTKWQPKDSPLKPSIDEIRRQF